MFKLKAKLLVLTVKAVLTVLVVLVPLLGVWFASSLTAYFNGPIWLALIAGLLFFPVLPLLWDWRATVKWRQKQDDRDDEPSVESGLADTDDPPSGRILVFWDRLILRTLAVNLALLVALGWFFPQEGFTALSARGDWMLDNAEGAWTEPVEDAIFATAEGLEFLHLAAHDNPFEEYADEETVIPESTDRGRFDESDDGDEPSPADGDDEQFRRGPMAWPPPDELHPVVDEIPASEETSIESVAEYIAAREDDPFYRVKALFDYVVSRVEYDVESLRGDDRAPQDAQTVFETQMAVCAGYARLLIALAEVTGDEIVYITGVSRDNQGEIGGGGHAWNAAKIKGDWYLLDPTWGAGHVGDEFNRKYNPVYLFTPPEVLINTHFPSEEAWQLLERPVSRSQFVRQPVLRAAFFSNRLDLIEPTRSQQRVGDEARIVVDNPAGLHLRGRLVNDAGVDKRCDTTDKGDDRTAVSCDIPDSGTYHVQLFGGEERFETMSLWGQIEVHGG